MNALSSHTVTTRYKYFSIFSVNLRDNIQTVLDNIKTFIKNHKRLTIVLVIVLLGLFLLLRSRSTSNKLTYQTATATRSTLISTVTASGTIVATNNIDVTSLANGQVAKVYVKEGDVVFKGQKLFDITLDTTGEQRRSQALSSYLSAKSSLNSANSNYYTLQAAEFAANSKFINDAVARNLATNDPTYIQENATWLAAEANFNNQQNSVSQTQASLTSAWLNYQLTAATITAPISGTIENITVVPGMAISTTSGTTIASIQTPGNPVATVNITEIDATKVKGGQKVTLTFDSIPNATFTGKIAGINKLGMVTGGVTNYPATIEFDSSSDQILPSMAVTAAIITNIKDNVITVPTGAIITQNGQTVVRVLKNGQITNSPVTTGSTSDTDTEIITGINEGDEVVTSVITSNTGSTSSSTSPFSGQLRFGGGGFGGGGGAAVRGR